MTGYFPMEEYEGRWARVEQELVAKGYAAAVVWGKTAYSFDRAGDVLYLTNYSSTKVGQPFDTSAYRARDYCAVILRRGETPELVVDDPGYLGNEIPTDRIVYDSDTVTAVARLLNNRPISGKVAFVGSDFFAFKYWNALQKQTTDTDWEICDDLVLNIRRRKSPRELECCREAGAIAAGALNELMTALVAGKPESTAASLAAAHIIRHGGIAERIACTHGDMISYSSREPRTGYSMSAPVRGDMVKGWLIGPMFQGYYMDPGRTAVAGKNPSVSQRHLIESCAEIVRTIAASIRPKFTYKQAADIGDRLVGEFGGDDDPLAGKHPFYGHPNGLYFEGPPYISNLVDHQDAHFHSGDVIGVEAFLNLKGVGAAGFEQNYIVHPSGVELITPAPDHWH